MKHSLPSGFNGYHAERGAFSVNVCLDCGPLAEVEKWAKPLAVRVKPCTKHFQEKQDKQHP